MNLILAAILGATCGAAQAGQPAPQDLIQKFTFEQIEAWPEYARLREQMVPVDLARRRRHPGPFEDERPVFRLHGQAVRDSAAARARACLRAALPDWTVDPESWTLSWPSQVGGEEFGLSLSPPDIRSSAQFSIQFRMRGEEPIPASIWLRRPQPAPAASKEAWRRLAAESYERLFGHRAAAEESTSLSEEAASTSWTPTWNGRPLPEPHRGSFEARRSTQGWTFEWTRGLTPDEARQALRALSDGSGPVTAREAVAIAAGTCVLSIPPVKGGTLIASGAAYRLITFGDAFQYFIGGINRGVLYLDQPIFKRMKDRDLILDAWEVSINNELQVWIDASTGRVVRIYGPEH